MDFDLWLAYALATAVVLAIPGPTVMLCVAYALSRGRRVIAPLTAGVVAGDFTAMTLSLAGVGAILAASATWFTVLKWIGAAYLVWLGVNLWRRGGGLDDAQVPARGHGAIAAHAFIVTALNPKGIAFFVAFVPQFIDPDRPVLLQLVILEATFIVMAGLNVIIFQLLADRVRGAFARPSLGRWLNRAAGTALIGAGFATAALKRL